MRYARSCACRSWLGFQLTSKMMTRDADCRLSPVPPARVEMRKTFFVKSVQRYRDQVDDPELQRAIRGFAGQEAQHSHQHDLHLALAYAPLGNVLELRKLDLGEVRC